MTEKEAKSKPCIGPAPHNTGAACNPNAEGEIVYACIGSACVAWRWVHVSNLAETVNGHPGYCGIAGKP